MADNTPRSPRTRLFSLLASGHEYDGDMGYIAYGCESMYLVDVDYVDKMAECSSTMMNKPSQQLECACAIARAVLSMQCFIDLSACLCAML